MRPLSNVRNEFFETFSSRASYAMFSKDDFEASKKSLQRMLDSFERDVARKDRCAPLCTLVYIAHAGA